MILLVVDLMLEIALKVNLQVNFSGLHRLYISKFDLQVYFRGILNLF